MLEFLGALKRFLTNQGVSDAGAHKIAATMLGKMDKGMALSPEELILGATYLKLGDIKGEATSTDFADAAWPRGYTEVEWTYALSPGTSKNWKIEHEGQFKTGRAARAGALRRRPTKIDPAEKGYTEVEWTYLGNGSKVPTKASIARLAGVVHEGGGTGI